ncbi:unnamed protein product [Paramecium octaurelia]|uniref:Rho-GAP domain-containing protein n=1 Tax=Paramecium octaurelia TaxID=43137 RepID=A0A8S1USH7_PAROT|nr:unnamed protein product [Paramecium octaurelia]
MIFDLQPPSPSLSPNSKTLLQQEQQYFYFKKKNNKNLIELFTNNIEIPTLQLNKKLKNIVDQNSRCYVTTPLQYSTPRNRRTRLSVELQTYAKFIDEMKSRHPALIIQQKENNTQKEQKNKEFNDLIQKLESEFLFGQGKSFYYIKVQKIDRLENGNFGSQIKAYKCYYYQLKKKEKNLESKITKIDKVTIFWKKRKVQNQQQFIKFLNNKSKKIILMLKLNRNSDTRSTWQIEIEQLENIKKNFIIKQLPLKLKKGRFNVKIINLIIYKIMLQHIKVILNDNPENSYIFLASECGALLEIFTEEEDTNQIESLEYSFNQFMIIDNEKKQIRELFANDQKYVQNEKKIQNDFIVQMQVAKYDSQNKDDPLLIQAGLTQSKQSVFIIQGKLQNDNNIRSITYYMISQLQNKKNQEFFVIYLNTELKTYLNLSKFYSVLKELPCICFENLQKIIIIHGNFLIKSWFLFQNSIQIQILKQKTIQLEKVAQLLNYQYFNKSQFEKLPSYCKDSSYQQLQQAFTVNQQMLVQVDQIQLYNLELGQYELTSKGIPFILDLCITKLLQNPQNIKLEGIFRLCSAQTHDKEFENYLIYKQYEELLDYENIIVIANFIKRVLDKLRYSVVPYQYYDQLNTIHHYSIEEGQKLIQQFPILNRNLFTLIILILQQVASHSDVNKMNASNLAIVFGITLCRPKEYQQENIQEQYQKIKIVNQFIQFLIENASQIFPNQRINDFILETDIEQKVKHQKE